jgi:4-aminobutyrate aminotransferase-like enzyme
MKTHKSTTKRVKRNPAAARKKMKTARRVPRRQTHTHTPFNPAAVFPTLRKHMLVDGFDLVIDLQRSKGSFIVDARDGKLYLDFFTFMCLRPSD